MESILLYLAKASGLIVLFLICYYFLLKKETFFSSIRFFLFAGILTSVALPLITFTKTVWITARPLPQIIPTANTFVTAPSVQQTGFDINWWYVAGTLYMVGVVFFLYRFVSDIFKVFSLTNKQRAKKEGRYKMVDSEKIVSPFSFFNYIVFNSSVLTPEEMESIIVHEKVHSRQLHSVDMLIAQLSCILLWFNPFCWLYKKQVMQNLEFIADAEAAKTISDIKVYQKTLLKITMQPGCIAITNHFYQSFIKKRIVMLNKKQSKKYNFWKFSVVLPALALFMYTYQTEIIAQQREIVYQNQSKAVRNSEATGTSASYAVTADTIRKSKAVNEIITAKENKTEPVQEKTKIVVVNGVIQTAKEVILTGKEVNITELSGEEAVKKYGDCAKYGAIVYTTVDFDPGSTDKTTIVTQTFTSTKTQLPKNLNTGITENVIQTNASPSRMVTVTTLHDNDGNLIVNDDETIYFTVSSTTLDIQLNGYKEDFAKKGITFEYSDIKRNSRGKITGIKLSLTEKGHKSSASWSTNTTKDGIPDVYIGKIKGKLTASPVK